MPFIPVQQNQFYEGDKSSEFLINGDLSGLAEILDSNNIFRFLLYFLIEERARNIFHIIENAPDHMPEEAQNTQTVPNIVNRFTSLIDHFNNLISPISASANDSQSPPSPEPDVSGESEVRHRRHRHHRHHRNRENQ